MQFGKVLQEVVGDGVSDLITLHILRILPAEGHQLRLDQLDSLYLFTFLFCNFSRFSRLFNL